MSHFVFRQPNGYFAVFFTAIGEIQEFELLATEAEIFLVEERDLGRTTAQRMVAEAMLDEVQSLKRPHNFVPDQDGLNRWRITLERMNKVHDADYTSAWTERLSAQHEKPSHPEPPRLTRLCMMEELYLMDADWNKVNLDYDTDEPVYEDYRGRRFVRSEVLRIQRQADITGKSFDVLLQRLGLKP